MHLRHFKIILFSDLNILIIVGSAIQPDLSKASLKFFRMRCQDLLFSSAISEKGTMSKEQDFIKPPARPAFTSFIFSFYPVKLERACILVTRLSFRKSRVTYYPADSLYYPGGTA